MNYNPDSIFSKKKKFRCHQSNCNSKTTRPLTTYINHMLTVHPNLLAKADIYFDINGLLKEDDLYKCSRCSDITFYTAMEQFRANRLESDVKDEEGHRKYDVPHHDIYLEWCQIRAETKRLLSLYREYYKKLEEAKIMKQKHLKKRRILDFIDDKRTELLNLGIDKEIIDSLPVENLLKGSFYEGFNLEDSGSESEDESEDESEEDDIVKKPYVDSEEEEDVVKKPYVDSDEEVENEVDDGNN